MRWFRCGVLDRHEPKVSLVQSQFMYYPHRCKHCNRLVVQIKGIWREIRPFA